METVIHVGMMSLARRDVSIISGRMSVGTLRLSSWGTMKIDPKLKELVRILIHQELDKHRPIIRVDRLEVPVEGLKERVEKLDKRDP